MRGVKLAMWWLGDDAVSAVGENLVCIEEEL